MKSLIIQLLEDKGLDIPEKDYDVLNDRWNGLRSMKQAFTHYDLQESDIDLIPGIGGKDDHGRTER